MHKEVVNKGKLFCWHDWTKTEKIESGRTHSFSYVAIYREKECKRCGRHIKKAGLLC